MQGLRWIGVLLLVCACNLGTLAPASTQQAAPTKTLVGTPAPADARSELSPPNAPINTPSATTCTRPNHWTSYTIQRGDVLSVLARRFGITLDELVAANCLENPDRIRVGQTIYVPNTGTPTP